MALHNFSFIVVTPEEFENCHRASAEVASTPSLDSLPVTSATCKPPSKFSAPVGVVSKLKKKNESLAISSHDSTLHNAPVTTPVFVIGCVPTKFTVIYAHSFSPLLSFLQASGISSSSSASSEYSKASSEYSDFSATSAADIYIGRQAK
jgi:hypothetical protein